MSLRRLAIAGFGLLAGLAGCHEAKAAEQGQCQVTTSRGASLGELRLLDVQGRFPDLPSRLGKGLTVTLLHTVEASDERTFTFGCKVFYDLWDETYTVTPVIGSVVADKRVERLQRIDELAPACVAVRLPWSLAVGEEVTVTSELDPVSDEQEAKTRRWLAEKGIGGNGGGAAFGRAALALVDLQQQERFARRCPAKGAP